MARIKYQLAGIGASDMADSAAFDAYIGLSREITLDPIRGIIALHDGITAGGLQFMPGGGIGEGEGFVPFSESFVGIAGNNQTYQLSDTPANADSIFVWVGGARQRPSEDYTLAGNTLRIINNPDGLDIDIQAIGGPYALQTLQGRTASDFIPATLLSTLATQDDIEDLASKVASPDIVVQRPETCNFLHMSDTNGATQAGIDTAMSYINYAKGLVNSASYVLWNGDMVSTGDGSMSPGDTKFDLDDWLDAIQDLVPRSKLWPIAGNHEVDRNIDASNPRWSATMETYRRHLGRKQYYFIVLGNMCFIRIGHTSRNGMGTIPDEIVDWCKRVVADHQWCSYIEISTHQPLNGSGLPGHTTLGILGSDRFTSWLGSAGYRVDSWFSGHVNYDVTNASVQDHTYNFGCLFVATDNYALTMVDTVVTDGSDVVEFKRYNRTVGTEPVKQWTLTLNKSVETAGIPTYDGRYVTSSYDVSNSPLTISVQPERIEKSSNVWGLDWKPYPVLTIALTDLANDNLEPNIGPAIDFLVPAATSGFADGEGSNTTDMLHSSGYGARIAALRTGNGERDFGASLNLYSSIPSTEPHLVGSNQYTEGQLRLGLKVIYSGGVGYASGLTGDPAEVFRWSPTGFFVNRTAGSTSEAKTGNVSFATGENRSFMGGTVLNWHQRVYNNADVSPTNLGGVASEGSSVRFYITSTVWISGGPGSPEGTVTGVVGCEWNDITNGVKYIKKTGTGNTGWKLITQAA